MSSRPGAELISGPRAGPSPSGAGLASRAVPPPVEEPLRSPVEASSVSSIEPAPPEPGADDAGRAIHIRAPRGSEVRSPFAGEILAVTHLTSAGLALDLVDAGRRRVIRLGHLLRIAPGVAPAARIEKGQLLGWVGDTGEPPPGEDALHLSVRSVPPDGRWWAAPPLDARAWFDESAR